jgi:hypothetical protein
MKFCLLAAILCAAVVASAQETINYKEISPRPMFFGTPSRVVIYTPKLKQSVAWWTRLGFDPLDVPGESADTAVTLSDGQIIITLTVKFNPSPILLYKASNLLAIKDTLDYFSIPYNSTLAGPSYSEFRLATPNKLYYIIRSNTLEPTLTVESKPNAVLGAIGEFSTACDNLLETLQWYTDAGYTVVKNKLVPYRFATISDSFLTIGIHERKEIPSTAITYYMPDMAERIATIKKMGYKPTDEYPSKGGVVADAVFTSPEGQLLYLFKTPQ